MVDPMVDQEWQSILKEVHVAKRTAVVLLGTLLCASIGNPCAAQTKDNAAQSNQATTGDSSWVLTAVDADGSSARAYLANTATGQTYDCFARYDWTKTTISEVVCRAFEVTPGTISPNKGPYVPSLLPVNGPQTVSLFVWFVNPNTGTFSGCVWNKSRQACKEGEI